MIKFLLVSDYLGQTNKKIITFSQSTARKKIVKVSNKNVFDVLNTYLLSAFYTFILWNKQYDKFLKKNNTTEFKINPTNS